jgi:serine/threonine-protein kinase
LLDCNLADRRKPQLAPLIAVGFAARFAYIASYFSGGILMDRWILCSALLVPALAGAFESGEFVVCIRSCEIKNGRKATEFMLPGTGMTVGEVKEGLVQDKKRSSNWVPADCLAAEKDAIDYFRRQIERNPDDVESRCGLALRLNTTDHDAALAEVNEAVRRKETWLTLDAKARVVSERGGWDKAVSILDRAVALEPDRLQLREFRAAAHVNAEKYRYAIVDYTYLHDHGGDAATALYGRGTAWVGMNEEDHARDDFEAALKLDETCVNCRMALTLLSATDTNDAVLKIEEFIKLYPNESEVHKTHGRLLRAAERYESAIQAFNRSLEFKPGQANVLNLRASCWKQLNAFDSAISDLNEAITLEPYDAQNWSWRGAVRAAEENEKQDELAIADFSEAIRLAPREWRWYAWRGDLLLKNCEYRRALEDYAKVAELDPSQKGQARTRMAWIYATCPEEEVRNGERAREIIRGLLIENGTKRIKVNVRLAEAVAAACAETGDFELAAAEQRKVVAKVSGNIEQAARERLALYEASKPYRLPTKKR